MEKSQNPNFHGIGGANEDDRRSTVGNSHNSEPILPERIETERVSKDKADQKRENDRLYRQRRKSKMETLEAENKKLVDDRIELQAKYDQVNGENLRLKVRNELLEGQIELVNKRLEIQSKEMDGLRKTCDRLEEKNAEEHERNRRLKSKLKKQKEKIQSLEQCKVNPSFEFRPNEMPQQFVAPQVQFAQVAPQVQFAQVAPENYMQLGENTLSWLFEGEDHPLENHTQMQVAEDYPPMQVAPGNNTT